MMKETSVKNEKNRKRWNANVPVWAIGAGIGVICLGIGLFHEQFADIYRKAALICLECIGIG